MSYTSGSETDSVHFNICAYTFRECNDQMRDFANKVNSNNTCNHLSSDSVSKAQVALADAKKPDKGVTITYHGGNLCNATDKYSLTIELLCDSTLATPSYEVDTSSIVYPCSPKIIMQAKDACPIAELHTLWKFFNQFYYIFGLIMMFCGLWLVILGGRYYKVTMFMAG